MKSCQLESLSLIAGKESYAVCTSDQIDKWKRHVPGLEDSDEILFWILLMMAERVSLIIRDREKGYDERTESWRCSKG